MASHEELVAELPKLERLSNAARLKLAKKRRQKQLKKFQEYTRVTRQVSRSERSPTSVNFDQNCLLQDAVTRNDSSEAEKVLRAGSNPNDSNADGLTPLHRCCIDNSFEMARILILNGADLNTRDIEGWTPLHAAAACGNLQIINLMVDSGADLVALNHDDKMPVDVGCDADIQYILQQKMLEAGYTDDTCQYIRSSVPKTMLADLKDSIKSGRSLNVQDKYGATALHVAAANGYSEVLDFLLQQEEVNMNIQDNEGWTPFHAAVCWGQKEVMQKLSEKGADMEIENIHGETPYAITDEAEIRQLILELKNQQNTRRMPTVVAKVETEDGAISDRASTPDQAVEGTPDMGRSRTSSRSLQARRSSTLKKDMVKRYSAKSERLIRQETMDQEDMERTMGGELIVDNIDNMDSLSPSSINESTFTTPMEDSMAKSDSLSSSNKTEITEKEKEGAAKNMQRRQLKSVLKKKGPSPVVTVSQQLDNDYEDEFEISSGRAKRQNTQECCTIS